MITIYWYCYFGGDIGPLFLCVFDLAFYGVKAGDWRDVEPDVMLAIYDTVL